MSKLIMKYRHKLIICTSEREWSINTAVSGVTIKNTKNFQHERNRAIKFRKIFGEMFMGDFSI
jgi:hypothetical protein